MSPQVKTTKAEDWSKYWRSPETLAKNLKLLSWKGVGKIIVEAQKALKLLHFDGKDSTISNYGRRVELYHLVSMYEIGLEQIGPRTEIKAFSQKAGSNQNGIKQKQSSLFT